jgi:hypothetical protein
MVLAEARLTRRQEFQRIVDGDWSGREVGYAFAAPWRSGTDLVPLLSASRQLMAADG